MLKDLGRLGFPGGSLSTNPPGVEHKQGIQADLISVYQENVMTSKLFYALAVLALVAIAATKTGSVRQSPPEPNCTLDPELCTKR